MNGLLNANLLILSNGSVYALPGLLEFLSEENKEEKLDAVVTPDPVDVVSKIVWEAFGKNFIMLQKKTKSPEYAFPRQVHMTLTQLSGFSQSESGAVFGKDHATALHAKRAVKNTLDSKYPAKYYAKAKICIDKFTEYYPNADLSIL